MNCRLKEFRKRFGLTQEGLSQILNVSQQTISRMEANESYITADILYYLSERYGVTSDYMLGLGEGVADTGPKAETVAFLCSYLSLDEEHQGCIRRIVHNLLENQRQFEKSIDNP